jgi:hypothetical protein
VVEGRLSIKLHTKETIYVTKFNEIFVTQMVLILDARCAVHEFWDNEQVVKPHLDGWREVSGEGASCTPKPLSSPCSEQVNPAWA